MQITIHVLLIFHQHRQFLLPRDVSPCSSCRTPGSAAPSFSCLPSPRVLTHLARQSLLPDPLSYRQGVRSRVRLPSCGRPPPTHPCLLTSSSGCVSHLTSSLKCHSNTLPSRNVLFNPPKLWHRCWAASRHPPDPNEQGHPSWRCPSSSCLDLNSLTGHPHHSRDSRPSKDSRPSSTHTHHRFGSGTPGQARSHSLCSGRQLPSPPHSFPPPQDDYMFFPI